MSDAPTKWIEKRGVKIVDIMKGFFLQGVVYFTLMEWVSSVSGLSRTMRFFLFLSSRDRTERGWWGTDRDQEQTCFKNVMQHEMDRQMEMLDHFKYFKKFFEMLRCKFDQTFQLFKPLECSNFDFRKFNTCSPDIDLLTSSRHQWLSGWISLKGVKLNICIDSTPKLSIFLFIHEYKDTKPDMFWWTQSSAYLVIE